MEEKREGRGEQRGRREEASMQGEGLREGRENSGALCTITCGDGGSDGGKGEMSGSLSSPSPLTSATPAAEDDENDDDKMKCFFSSIPDFFSLILGCE